MFFVPNAGDENVRTGIINARGRGGDGEGEVGEEAAGDDVTDDEGEDEEDDLDDVDEEEEEEEEVMEAHELEDQSARTLVIKADSGTLHSSHSNLNLHPCSTAILQQ